MKTPLHSVMEKIGNGSEVHLVNLDPTIGTAKFKKRGLVLKCRRMKVVVGSIGRNVCGIELQAKVLLPAKFNNQHSRHRHHAAQHGTTRGPVIIQ